MLVTVIAWYTSNRPLTQSRHAHNERQLNSPEWCVSNNILASYGYELYMFSVPYIGVSFFNETTAHNQTTKFSRLNLGWLLLLWIALFQVCRSRLPLIRIRIYIRLYKQTMLSPAKWSFLCQISITQLEWTENMKWNKNYCLATHFRIMNSMVIFQNIHRWKINEIKWNCLMKSFVNFIEWLYLPFCIFHAHHLSLSRSSWIIIPLSIAVCTLGTRHRHTNCNVKSFKYVIIHDCHSHSTWSTVWITYWPAFWFYISWIDSFDQLALFKYRFLKLIFSI